MEAVEHLSNRVAALGSKLVLVPFVVCVCSVLAALIGYVTGIRQARILNPPMLRVCFWAVKLVEARNNNEPWKVTNCFDAHLEAAVDHFNELKRKKKERAARP